MLYHNKLFIKNFVKFSKQRKKNLNRNTLVIDQIFFLVSINKKE